MSMNELDLHLFLSQKLAEMASAMMQYYDCCGIKMATCKAGDPNPCCLNSQFGKGLCPFWMHGKCQFENCDCRLWICNTAIETTDPKCVEALKLLEQFAKLYGLVRTPLIGERYSGADRQPQRNNVDEF